MSDLLLSIGFLTFLSTEEFLRGKKFNSDEEVIKLFMNGNHTKNILLLFIMTPNLFAQIPARHVLCFMFLTGFIFVFMIRVNINLAVVGMVKTSIAPKNASSLYNIAAENETLKYEENAYEGEFEWDEFQQGIILGSFFYGYMASQIPGGRIAELYGMKPVFGMGIFVNGLLSLLIPFSARIHWVLLFLLRVMQGLAQGVLYPALSACIANWVPITERARFISITVQGCSVGPVIALPLCGWILTAWGWPSVFYVTGALALIWYGFWMYLVYDVPEKHPRISLEERKFLEENLKEKSSNHRYPFPWKKVLLSSQFWLGTAAHVGSDWGFHTFYTFGPKYIRDALNFDINQSAILSSLPFLCQYISATLVGIVVDKLLTKYKISLRRIRKISVFFSHCMPGILVIILTFIGQDVNLSVAIFTLAVSMLGALTTGHYQNPIDIAPNFAGSLTGIANTLGSLGGILCTTIAGISLQNYGSPEGWYIIFYVAATVYGLTGIPFIIWAKSKELPWNAPREKAPVELKLLAKQENGESVGVKTLCNNIIYD